LLFVPAGNGADSHVVSGGADNQVSFHIRIFQIRFWFVADYQKKIVVWMNGGESNATLLPMIDAHSNNVCQLALHKRGF
jgi:hypothetical protein